MRAVSLTLCFGIAAALTGCLADRRPFANNPLLLYYKPTLSDSETVLAEREQRGGPSQPPMPTLAAGSPTDASPFTPPKLLPREPILPAKSDAPAEPGVIQPIIHTPAKPSTKPNPGSSLFSQLKPVPASTPIASDAAPSAPPSAKQAAASSAGEKRKVAGQYGHDAPYTWLQGVVEKSYHGHDCIRYCDPSVDDEYGGKFFVDDPRLAQFQDGDVIGVSGELAPAVVGGERTRKYTIQDLWLVKAKP